MEKKYFLALLSSHTLSFLCLDVRLSSGEKWQRWTNVPTGFGLVSEYDGESYGEGWSWTRTDGRELVFDFCKL